MKYDELPVFKAAYDLILDVFKSSQTIKREYRYTLGEELKREIVKLMMCVYRANLTVEKEPHIVGAREHIEIVRLQIRLLHDLGQMPIRTMARMNLNIESISKQLAAWHKSVATKNKTKQEEKITQG
ncbi:MAG: four helix bundle protein [Rikenellaceae bacterium]|jgi:hypothetical protein|nr:four helix bundle protein [Rikenellaceae bacterium]